ncbi:MAG: hypothetical protein A3H57_00520 [Candidatus Taylorbacteria bacterium RIFCSPLOWO2_02_FULL_43_11]|nr:MAG: hypothetical protein A3B08_02420 [Candidatus Taylorbacteria bacterium RIFCSPLOWO2_01_FULL_43_44]OHA35777.1 MAG: hypothetical protein A3H57_00520 [Candidatus Taylorbacteria bacterium RIFCSPLOWO2_02_FULL_43_11]
MIERGDEVSSVFLTQIQTKLMKTLRNRLLVEMAALIAAVSFVQASGIFFGFYAMFWWWDIVAHFLGGAFLGLLFVWLFFYSGYFGWAKSLLIGKRHVLISVFFAIITACLWEIYEYLLGPFFSYGNYVYDTTKDIFMGTAGAFVSSTYFVVTKLKK